MDELSVEECRELEAWSKATQKLLDSVDDNPEWTFAPPTPRVLSRADRIVNKLLWPVSVVVEVAVPLAGLAMAAFAVWYFVIQPLYLAPLVLWHFLRTLMG